jgi:hypothetical protein
VSKFVDDIILSPVLEDTAKGYMNRNVHMLLYFHLLRSDYLSDYALQTFNSGIFALTAEPGVSQHTYPGGQKMFEQDKKKALRKAALNILSDKVHTPIVWEKVTNKKFLEYLTDIKKANSTSYSWSGLNGMRSAFEHLKRGHGIVDDARAEKDLKDDMAGIKKNVAHICGKGGGKAHSGMALVSWELYRKILHWMLYDIGGSE